MAIEIKVPQAGESVTEAMVASWKKAVGEWVSQDDPVVTLETDKATVDVPAPASGVLVRILHDLGAVVRVGEVLGVIDETASRPSGDAATPAAPPKEAPPAPPRPETVPPAPPPTTSASEPRVMPAARRILAEAGIPATSVTPTGPGGRVLKEDALEAARTAPPSPPPAARPPAPPAPVAAPIAVPEPPLASPPVALDRQEEVVPMSMIRRRIAERLVQARLEMALLTTFNEIDMTRVISLRRERGEAFQARHGVKLGFMSFFVKAAVDALKRFPVVNASVRGTDIVYHNHYDIGVAIGGGKGLVVPVLRDADRLSLAAIERAIADFGRRAQENRLDVAELQGGTFTISNGGVYGSMLSTPIVNPPQSGVLGLHAIQDRPVVRDGQIVARPMMYVALSYDHRIIDGREAVSFLKHLKELVEDPALLMLEL